MDGANSHEARISVLETKAEAHATSQRDVWESVEKLRSCLLSGLTEIRKDAAATRLWVATGVVGLVLPGSAFMFAKLMGW